MKYSLVNHHNPVHNARHYRDQFLHKNFAILLYIISLFKIIATVRLNQTHSASIRTRLRKTMVLLHLKFRRHLTCLLNLKTIKIIKHLLIILLFKKKS